MIPIVTRAVAAGDIDFVFDSWLRSYSNYLKIKSSVQEKLPKWKDPLVDVQVFFVEHRHLLTKLDANITIAVNPADLDQIYGWICYTRPDDETIILHYCFVKQPFRRLSIGKGLLEIALGNCAKVFYTHFTESGTALLKHIRKTAVYNPYMLRPQ